MIGNGLWLLSSGSVKNPDGLTWYLDTRIKRLDHPPGAPVGLSFLIEKAEQGDADGAALVGREFQTNQVLANSITNINQIEPLTGHSFSSRFTLSHPAQAATIKCDVHRRGCLLS